MIRRALPSRFIRKTENGRTEPLRIALITDDDVEHEAILKVSKGIELGNEGLANEMLGSLIAADLGLRVNEPFFVELLPEFIESLPTPEMRSRLSLSSPLAFASKDAGKQWRGWNSTDKVSQAQISDAFAVIAFDSFIGNSDRSPNNPNLLVKDHAWCLIDHESAFSFRLKLFPRCQPWVAGNLSGMTATGALSEHVFTAHLAKRNELTTGATIASWRGLSDARFAQYDALLPNEWDDVRPQFTEAISHLK